VPIKYSRDDTKRRIRVTLANPLTIPELIESVERQLADGGWTYGLLVDARTMLPPPKPIDIQAFLSRVRELTATHGPRGPIAIVSKESSSISGAQMYIFFGGKTEFIDVFWDLDVAQEWLDERMAAGPRTISDSD
jgi:hypothetical protein